MASIDEQFHTAVERLSAPAEEQAAYVTQLGTAPSTDELALEFSDALVLVREDLAEPARKAALRLDDYLSEMSGPDHAQLWMVSALSPAPEWACVRQLAQDVLRCLRSQMT